MENNTPQKRHTTFVGILITLIRHWRLVLVSLALLLIGIIVLQLKSCDKPITEITSTNPENKISLSPEEIRDIEEIGQWVFLSIQTEEMVDTVRKRLFVSDDELSRIYVGTLHFGINMKELQGKDWLNCHGDTATMTLPKVRLMDRHFINEAKTRTFFQEGDWNSHALKALYQKAERQMLKRSHTQKNLEITKKNAQTEVETFFKAFGFNTVEITFEP